MRFISLVPLLLAVVLAIGTLFSPNRSSASAFENAPLYQIVPGKNIGAVHLLMTVEAAKQALLRYGTSVRHTGTASDEYESYCVEPGEHLCAFTTDRRTIDTVEARGDSQFWVAIPGDPEGLHLLSAGARHFVAAFGHPDCQGSGMAQGQKGMSLGWDKPGLAGVFFADSDTLMVYAVQIDVPGGVCH